MTWFSALPYSLLLPFVFSSLLKRQRNFRTWFPSPLILFTALHFFLSAQKKQRNFRTWFPTLPYSLHIPSSFLLHQKRQKSFAIRFPGFFFSIISVRLSLSAKKTRNLAARFFRFLYSHPIGFSPMKNSKKS